MTQTKSVPLQRAHGAGPDPLSYADRSIARAETLRAEQKRTTPREPTGRRRRRGVREQHLRLGRDLAIDPVERRVDDPFAPGERVVTGFNRRVDILENELAHGRLTPQDHALGRLMQAVLERASGRVGSGGFTGGDKVDAFVAHELAIILATDDARACTRYLQRVELALGGFDTMLIRKVLGERMGFADLAAHLSKPGRDGTRYYGERFRDALKLLVEKWAARGKRILVEDDRVLLAPETPDAPRRRGAVLPQIRGERAEAQPDEDVDVTGVVVPAGKGFRVANDVGAVNRWRPAERRKSLEGDAGERLGRTRRR